MARTAATTIVGLLVSVAVTALGVSPARAQDISARDRQAASEAYDRGTAAFLAREYESAARWFETAHRLAPAAAALVQAARSYQRSGDDVRSATLALRLEALYPDDRAAQRAARDGLRNARRFVRVDVECQGCTVALEGSVLEHRSFFIAPGADHVVEASFETGSHRETVRGDAGETRTLRFEAPPPPIVEPRVEPPADPLPIVPVEPRPQPASLSIVPLPVTIVAAVVTGALGGVLVWSGVDALDGVPAYEANPTPAALADGQSREARTNWLVAGTALAGVTTLVLALFTDAGGGGQPAVDVSVALQGDGALCALRGRF